MSAVAHLFVSIALLGTLLRVLARQRRSIRMEEEQLGRLAEIVRDREAR
ncbi:hypothetical protein [Sphingomonas bacterium]|nr:hypothetical protein [Sphingomonas bacterium]